MVPVAQERGDLLGCARPVSSAEMALTATIPAMVVLQASLDLVLERRDGDEGRVVVVRSHWGLPFALDLQGSTIRNGTARMRTVLPTGSAPSPKSLSATVAPTTMTLAPDWTSVSAKREPLSMTQLRMSKNSGDVPVRLVVQLRSSAVMVTLVIWAGAAQRTAGAWVWMALRSSQVERRKAPRKPPETPPVEVEPERTMSMFVPMAANTLETRAFAPSPTATIEMTEATPMMTPSAVRKLRVLLRISAVTAMGMTLARFMVYAAFAARRGSCGASETILPSRTTTMRDA